MGKITTQPILQYLIEKKLEIESTPEKIYKIVIDGLNTPKWNPIVTAVTPIEDEKIQLETDIGSIKDDILVNKLLWGHKTADSQALEVISACALFEHFGFSDGVEEQRIFIAEKKLKENEENTS